MESHLLLTWMLMFLLPNTLNAQAGAPEGGESKLKLH